LSIVSAGCQTMTSQEATRSEPDALGSSKSEEMVMKTDFRRKADTNQKFNVHLELGRAYESEGNYEAAVNEYQKSIEACKRGGSFASGIKIPKAQEAESHRRMAGALDRLGRFERAEAHYRTALELSPNDAKVWNDSGYSYYLQARHADAERNLKTAEKLDPNNPRIQTNLGLAMAAAGKTDEALAALSKAGGPAAGNANLAYLLAAMGKTDEARKHYHAALRLQPEMAPAREALARLDADRIRSSQMAAIPNRPSATTDRGIQRVATPVGVSPEAPKAAVVPSGNRSYKR
jgi:tetratricopeptide (TPR) repeat protein